MSDIIETSSKCKERYRKSIKIYLLDYFNHLNITLHPTIPINIKLYSTPSLSSDNTEYSVSLLELPKTIINVFIFDFNYLRAFKTYSLKSVSELLIYSAIGTCMSINLSECDRI